MEMSSKESDWHERPTSYSAFVIGKACSQFLGRETAKSTSMRYDNETLPFPSRWSHTDSDDQVKPLSFLWQQPAFEQQW